MPGPAVTLGDDDRHAVDGDAVDERQAPIPRILDNR
jgi:hypothetical protein